MSRCVHRGSTVGATVLCFIMFAASCFAIPPGGAVFGTEIKTGDNATHIFRITKDSLIVAAGSTYSFTVDTPEDRGLVATNADVPTLLRQIVSADGSTQRYTIVSKEGRDKPDGVVVDGDRLVVTSQDGRKTSTYIIATHPMALCGKLTLQDSALTVNTTRAVTLSFTAGQRTPDATVEIYVPGGIAVTMDNTTVNVIGRGAVALRDLGKQSIGRTGNLYSYTRVGSVDITTSGDGGSLLAFRHLDLRPANGADLVIVIGGVRLSRAGEYVFRARYVTSKPEVLYSPGRGAETATLTAAKTIADFGRIVDRTSPYVESPDTYTHVQFTWTPSDAGADVRLMHSSDGGKTWSVSRGTVDETKGTASVSGLDRNKLYAFRLSVKRGGHKGFSNIVRFFSGKMDVKRFGVNGRGDADDTDKINGAIEYLASLGGGTLYFTKGAYAVRTLHLKSNVYLYVDKEATIKALKGGDAPETAWFSDKQYRSGLSPTDMGPYADPENFMTKQDVGHTYFRNCMFFGERLDNVKIIGNGRITGDGNLVTSDKVMNNSPDNRTDKMFTFKLCTNVEIGGVHRPEDLWYDPDKDEPYYIKQHAKDFDVGNMLNIDRGGHFVLLATGTDNIHVHDTYLARFSTSNVRDVYDFMACNDVVVTNIYSKVSSDDVVKPGSDCSLGFTRPARNYRVRNVIADTNCNLFQIGSETADDIMDVHVDNIYVLGANKAGFSISTNDGAHIKDIHLNCGHTGVIRTRSKMYRTFTPFFISISNRGRILGAQARRYVFESHGKRRDELLITNVNIGKVENIMLNGVDISEVYRGSSYRGGRWKPYDGSQRRATPIIAGYSLPDSALGGLDFRLPDGRHTGYIKNLVLNDMRILVKGGNPLSDTLQDPPELGVGQYNVSNLGVQPSYGLWARHVDGLTITDCEFRYETRDSRYALFLEDVRNTRIARVKMVKPGDNRRVICLRKGGDVDLDHVFFYDDRWDASVRELSPALLRMGNVE